jgi:hypothetical protein
MAFFRRQSQLWGFLAFLFFLVFHSACNSREPLNQTAQTFRDRTLEDFDRLMPRLLLALDSDNPVPAADAVIKAFLVDSHRNGCRMSGIGVLEGAGAYVTGYGFDDNDSGSPRRDEYDGIKFGSLKHLDLWETRNHDPPARKATYIPELIIEPSYSQLPETEYWLQ